MVEEEPAGYGLPAPQAHHTAGQYSALAYPIVYGCFRRCNYPMVPLPSVCCRRVGLSMAFPSCLQGHTLVYRNCKDVRR